MENHPEDQKSKNSNVTNWINAISTLVVALFAIISFYYLRSEVSNIKQQTETIENTYKKSFRPLPQIHITLSKPDTTNSDKKSIKCIRPQFDLPSLFLPLPSASPRTNVRGKVMLLSETEFVRVN